MVATAALAACAAEGLPNEGSITGDEALSVRLGTSKSEVIEELGEPLNRRPDARRSFTRREGRRVESCIIYRSGDNPPEKQGWRLCFDEDEKLASRGPNP